MGLFDSRGTRRGRKKGESLRLLHTTSGVSLLSGQALVKKAGELAYSSWWREAGVPDKDRYETDYINAFVLAYTNSRIVSDRHVNVKDIPFSQEMDVPYDERG